MSATIQDALDCLRESDFAQAESLCREIIQREPSHHKAWHLCGIAQAQQNLTEDALESFQQATRNDPSVAVYHYNLGLALKQLGKNEDAVESYREAIRLKPTMIEAHNNLGNTLQGLGRNREAVDCLRNLVQEFPKSSVGHFNLGNLLQDIGEGDECLVHLRRAIELDPELSAARENLGRALADMDRLDEAAKAWHDWLEQDPSNPVARHMLAAVSDNAPPKRCDDDYVRETFNEDFAQSFDSQLERLDYRAPQLVGDAIAELDGNRRDLNVLDAGCGTGLCAVYLRDAARRLVGVDLSADMLRRAEDRDQYDELIEQELTEFFRSHRNEFDWIVSADTFCYFGELHELFTSAHDCLKESGVLVFTVELSDQELGSTYHLQANGRYQHERPYVDSQLTSANFQVRSIKDVQLRNERGMGVQGLLVVAEALGDQNH